MRTLKFRAWDSRNKKYALTGFHIIGECTVFDLVKQYSIENFVDLEVEQYTGYKDCNGKDIYEGDVFKPGVYPWDAVEFENGQWQVNLRGCRIHNLAELIEDGHDLEVVGNIHENPELLK